jgi:hypothetical protein
MGVEEENIYQEAEGIEHRIGSSLPTSFICKRLFEFYYCEYVYQQKKARELSKYLRAVRPD